MHRAYISTRRGRNPGPVFVLLVVVGVARALAGKALAHEVTALAGQVEARPEERWSVPARAVGRPLSRRWRRPR